MVCQKKKKENHCKQLIEYISVIDGHQYRLLLDVQCKLCDTLIQSANVFLWHHTVHSYSTNNLLPNESMIAIRFQFNHLQASWSHEIKNYAIKSIDFLPLYSPAWKIHTFHVRTRACIMCVLKCNQTFDRIEKKYHTHFLPSVSK